MDQGLCDASYNALQLQFCATANTFNRPLLSSIAKGCKKTHRLSKSVASSIVQSKCPTASETFCNRYLVRRKGRQVVPCMPAVHGGCVISVSSFQAVDACEPNMRI